MTYPHPVNILSFNDFRGFIILPEGRLVKGFEN